MRRNPRTAACGALLMLMLGAAVATASASTTLPLGTSPQIPAAQGKVRLRTTQNGNLEIKLTVKHLAPPERVVSGSNVFVVWVRGLAADAEAQNVGALIVDKHLNGKLTAATALSSFDLFITCEQAQAVTHPRSPELLPVHYSRQ